MAQSLSLDDVSGEAEIRSFFRAIKENPDDDTPRLIFADWLQERGDAHTVARGEFLRLRVLRHRVSPDDPSYDLFRRREEELFTRNCWSWLSPQLLSGASKAWSFERGMFQIIVAAIILTIPGLRAWARTPSALWIDGLTILELTQRHVLELAYSPFLTHVNRLDLSGNRAQPVFSLLHHAFRSKGLSLLTELNLEGCNPSPHQIQSFVRLPELRCLKRLDLRSNHLDDIAARWLAESYPLKNVAELRLEHNRFTSDGMAVLRDAFGERVQLGNP